MAEMILEPLTVHLHFTLPESTGISKWDELLSQFLETLAKLCQDSGPCLIGHIKGLALLNGNRYIKASVVSASLPAQIETNASEELSDITVTLNILVYGLSKQRLQELLEQVMVRPGTCWRNSIVVEQDTAVTLLDRPSHHY